MLNFVFNFIFDVQLCGNGYILQQERVILVWYFAKEASCSMLREDVFFLQEKQETTIEKAMRNKRKCITTVKGLHLFDSALGGRGFSDLGLFFAFYEALCI
ncbi:uncharacterized protein LOC103939550 [Pyrus x bretschneideri]|uniref:uncharacterized protein LOC103939550 n=1 Tax=Pyrus x bretschneideri TaxID=225117 RepID=UPI00202DFB1C|nr:uncharacterized protein LOC103939550 [Pyrus x bretschneideri]